MGCYHARFHFAGKFSPRPLRTKAYMRGFPWLRNADKAAVDLANFFVDQCVRLAKLQCAVGGFFLPEQLGKVHTIEIPGSIWDFPELRELVEQTSSATWPIHQCFFGAESPKPTRLASNLPGAIRFGQCWPMLDSEGSYMGPLGHCPHHHTEPLLGQSATGWKTSSSAAYPALFCTFLARLIFSATAALRQVAHGMDSLHYHPAEALAEAILHSGHLPLKEDVLACFELLPRTRAHKATGHQEEGSAFFAGANWEAAGLVLRQNSFIFPMSCTLICKFIRHLDKAHEFAAFVIMQNVCSSPRRDMRNSWKPNLVAAVSDFEQGGIWHESPGGSDWREIEGQWRRGEVISLQPRSPPGHTFIPQSCGRATDALSLPTSQSSWSIFHRLMLPICWA